MVKRVFLFLMVNFLVLIMVSAIVRLFGLDVYLSQSGAGYKGLFIMCLLWGTVGSFVSLMISKWMVKRMMGVEIVDSRGEFSEIVQTVHELARKAGLEKMPEVGVYRGEELNAFATGPSKNNSLVAVSTGLLRHMDRDQVRGVLGHEIAHIANGDMVTMALLQGVMNAFVMFFARVATIFVDNVLRGDDDEGRVLGFFAHFMIVSLFEMIFGFLSMFVIAGFSRWREYRADAGGAKLAGKLSMIGALEGLKANISIEDPNRPKEIKYFQISGKTSLMELLSSHPPLDKRIAALKGRM